MKNNSHYYPPAHEDGRIQGAVGKIIDQYAPLVKAMAWRYKGRGAEYDDLVQEGYLALLLLLPKCPDMKWLAYFLKAHLPGYVRAAAARMRQPAEDGEFLLESIEETMGEEDENYKMIETEIMLNSMLSHEDLRLVRELYKGATHAEAARALGVSRQRVTTRMNNIRKKLRVHLECSE